MFEEAVKCVDVTPLLAVWENEDAKKLRQSCSGMVPVCVHSSLYRAVKLTFPWDIGGFTIDSHI